MDRGKFDALVTFQRATVTTDDYGGETPTWAQLVQAWAQVRAGTGAERRQAAQESAEQTRTFVTDWNPTLETVKVTDRIQYRGSDWDITDVALDGNREIQFTATRSV